MTTPRAELRRDLRAARQRLSEQAQRIAAERVAAHLRTLLAGSPPAVVASYLATDGEVSPHVAVAELRAAGSQIAYPRVSGDDMTFHLVGDEGELVAGRWGLSEPPPSAPVVDPADIDLVLTPLVGFDEAGNRLGRGRGYYDRAFAFLARSPRPERPRLIGLAHEVQRVDALTTTPHDVALDAVVTAERVYRPRGS